MHKTLLTMALCAPSVAVANTYDFSFNVGLTQFSDNISGDYYEAPEEASSLELLTVTGQIVTDGTLGEIKDTNIQSWQISLFDASYGIDVTYSNATPGSFWEFHRSDGVGFYADSSDIYAIFGDGGEQEFEYSYNEEFGQGYFNLVIGDNVIMADAGYSNDDGQVAVGYQNHFFPDDFFEIYLVNLNDLGTAPNGGETGSDTDLNAVPLPAGLVLLLSAAGLLGLLKARDRAIQ